MSSVPTARSPGPRGGGWLPRSIEAGCRAAGAAGAISVLAFGLGGCAPLSEAPPSSAISFTISGRLVTLASHNASLLGRLQSKHLYLDCNTWVADDTDEPGPEVGAPVIWPARATKTQVTVPVRLAVTDADSTDCQLTPVPASGGDADDPDPPIAGAVATVTGPPPVPERRAVQAVGLPGVRFSLNGRSLRITAEEPGRLLDLVRGQRIYAMCVSGEATRAALTNQSGPGFYAVEFSRTVRWGARADSFSVTLPFDVSATVDDCWLQDPVAVQDVSERVPPGDLAEAAFTVAGRGSIHDQMDGTTPSNIERTLRRAAVVARTVLLRRSDPPSAAQLADSMANSSTLSGVILVDHAASLRGVLVPGAIYVVGSDRHRQVKLAALTGTLRLCVVTAGS